ncbi:MAG: bifunctional UDP-N-acetylglucosamine diphosphorylase/glucosamine-1-phosphate N-acetyltransferase GlmU [Acidobacteriota bacterium]|nr:bifunctional UDP-N-acetylglucosamine diphosphorylase/glucosamine-1-phosphate N-acetyltransferase GlmU [Acidobacteriota bacterium]
MGQSFTTLILAAGAGTRMRSRVPKVLHDLCGRPLVLWPVHAALDAGSERVVVVDGPARALEAVMPPDVELVVQPEANGTGGAVLAATDTIERTRPVLVLSGDVPLVSAAVITDLVRRHAEGGTQATMLTTSLADPSGYGRVVRDADGFVARVAETKAAGDASEAELAIMEVNTGIYVFDPNALLDALPRLSDGNAQRELYLPQALELIRAGGGRVGAHATADVRAVLGVNDRVQLARVRSLARQEINERHMLAGVGVVDPSSTFIDAGVEIGEDATIEPATRLLGTTTVGRGASVGPNTTAIDSRIGARAEVRASWLQEATVGEAATVGPFAYLRPGTMLGERSKAGAFVEVKNSTLGRAAKVPHLSYIGDAEIGEEANLGAATITANYDGRRKHRTRVGDRVRAGVDTTFVAPVTVGDDAYTAAGSVITGDVPPGALAVARSRQHNVEGYAERAASRAGDAPGAAPSPPSAGASPEGDAGASAPPLQSEGQ